MCSRIKILNFQIVTIPTIKLTSNVILDYPQPGNRMKECIPFSVANGRNIRGVKTILQELAREAAERTSGIVPDPAPSIHFLDSGVSGMNGQMILSTNNYNSVRDVQNSLNTRIADRFHKEGVMIPFRQVDIGMRLAGVS